MGRPPQSNLPATRKVRTATHHAALPYDELPEFMAGLREREGISARALEFTILTAARTGEAIGAKWSEIGQGWRVDGASRENEIGTRASHTSIRSRP